MFEKDWIRLRHRGTIGTRKTVMRLTVATA